MLRIDYLNIPPLPALSFEVPNGMCLAIEGDSGSGKTRLLRAIADLDPATGDVFLDGAERREIPAPQWRSLVRYVSAEPAWWSATARTAIVGPEPYRVASDPDRLQRALSTVGLSKDVLDEPIATLSTGQRQRLALLRALADEPRVLLLDEPTAALDPTSAALVEELIRFQMLAGRIILLISHDAKLRSKLATERLDITRIRNEASASEPREPVLPRFDTA